MTVGTSRLSEVARHVVQPVGIVGTAWPAVRDTCGRLGWGFDGWQDGAGRLILAKRGDGMYAADQILVSIPRQVGKTYLFGAICFALCLLCPGLTVIWTAHRVKTAKETFNSMSGLASQAKVAAQIRDVYRGRGDESILFVNGSRILFGAREAGFGRGFSGVDVLVFDEAQILSESAMEDMVAAQNVAPNPLTILTGTPPRPKDPGEVFTLARQEALDGDTDETLYIELSADRASDPMDRSQWRKANPSFPSRTPERAMLRMRKNLSEDSFRREALGIWDELSRHQPVIKKSQWVTLADVGPGDGVRPDCLGVDMSHARQISVGACWNELESSHIEEVWAGTDTAAAIDWIVERAGRRMPVLIDGMSPASAMIPDLKGRGVNVSQSTAGDMAKGCGLFEDRAKAGTLTHGDQGALNNALEGARKRLIRDAGGWGWDRSDPTSLIHPIVAGTLALLGAATVKPRTGKAFFV
jgi:hypothetical protein